MKHIGRYRLIAEIGHGGMADVYLALAPGPNGFNKAVVVKALRGEAPDDRSVAMFLDEARIAARLNHPSIVQTHEVGYDGGGRPFLAMEFVEGQSLQSLLRRAKGGAPLPVLLRVISDVLAALDYAHALTDFDGTPLDLVHRDVTPHNVIVSYDGFGKLLDFGIAKATVRSAQTQAGMIKGKVAYMSPEQANGGAIDRRSDLFSVGVMLYQALSGRRFWGDEPDMPVLVKLSQGQLPDLRAGLAGAPGPLAAVVLRAVAASPADRYGAAAEFQADLERAAGALAPRRDVGAYVGGLFASERSGLRDVLDRHSSRDDEGGAYSRRGAPSSVTLTVEAHPPQARLFLDDRPLATNPAAVPVAAGEHRVRAEAEGFAAASQAVAPRADGSVVLTLRPLKGRAAGPGRGGAQAAPKAPSTPPAPPRENASSSAAKGADLAGF
jgi:serine/threonine protein kinase